MADHELPESLSLDQSFRAAFYLALAYWDRGHSAPDDTTLFVQYMWSDPARWSDWQQAVRRALSDDGSADPDHEGIYRADRPVWPSLE